jgi:hypothetical protein
MIGTRLLEDSTLPSRRRLTFGCLKAMVSTIELHKAQRELRGMLAEQLVAIMLMMKHGIYCYSTKDPAWKRVSQHADLIAVKPFNADPTKVPIQVKSASSEKHGPEIRIDDKPLQEFDKEGWYVVLIECDPEDIYLYITSDDMRKMMCAHGESKPAMERHHSEKYWSLYVPKHFNVLIQHSQEKKFVSSVLD